MGDASNFFRKHILRSKNVLESIKTPVEHVISVLMGNPTEIIPTIQSLRSLPLTIRDEIFWDCLETYIIETYHDNTNCHDTTTLRAISVALAEASPNEEANYEGNQEQLEEYAKRIIKVIDDCGTKQKAVYLAHLTRALLHNEIDTTKFFQLSRCIRYLTEESLTYMDKNITEGTVSCDSNYIDDFTSLGLMYPAENKFAYSRRAFELDCYALNYEKHRTIPDHYPLKPNYYIVRRPKEDVKVTNRD